MRKLIITALFLVVWQAVAADGVGKVLSGSGFFITNDGYFVTSYHVVEGVRQASLVLPNRSVVAAAVIAVDKANDLAILKAPGHHKPLPIADSSIARRGSVVMTVGYPNIDIQGSEPKVTRGIINSTTGIDNDPRVFQIDLPVQPGNSGGPLVTDEGLVVGIVGYRLSTLFVLKQTGELPQNVNYAVKSNYLLHLIETVPGVRSKLSTKPRRSFSSLASLTQFVEEATAIVLAESQGRQTAVGPRHSKQPRAAEAPRSVAPPPQPAEIASLPPSTQAKPEPKPADKKSLNEPASSTLQTIELERIAETIGKIKREYVDPVADDKLVSGCREGVLSRVGLNAFET